MAIPPFDRFLNLLPKIICGVFHFLVCPTFFARIFLSLSAPPFHPKFLNFSGFFELKRMKKAA